MATKKYLVDIDLALNELQNAVMQTIPGVTAGADAPGRLVFDTADSILKYNDGTAWIKLGTAPAAQTLTVRQSIATELVDVKIDISGGNTGTITGATTAHAGVMTFTHVIALNDTLRKGDAKTAVAADNKLITESDMAGAGLGDVVGPASSVDNNVAVFSGITGKIIKDGAKKISDLITDPNTVTSDSATGEDFIQLGAGDARGIKTSTAKIGDFIHKNGTIKLTADWLGNTFRAGFLAVRTDLVYTQSSDMIVRAGDQVASASQKMLTLQAYEGIVVDNYSSSSIALTVNGKGKFTSTVEGIAPTADLHLATKKYVDDNDDHLESVSGTGDSAVTFTLTDTTTVEWDATHSHSEYVPNNTSSTINGTLTVNSKVITTTVQSVGDLLLSSGSDAQVILAAYNGVVVNAPTSGDALKVNGTSEFTDNITTIDPTASVHVATKGYVDSAVVGGVVYRGGWNAETNTPPLIGNGSMPLKHGDMYSVTHEGIYDCGVVIGEVHFKVGDSMIAKSDTMPNAATCEDWVLIESDIQDATETGKGLIELATQGEVNSGSILTPLAVTPVTLKSHLDDRFAGNARRAYKAFVGPAPTVTVPHNFNNEYVTFTCWDGNTEIQLGVSARSVNSITLTANPALTAGTTYHVVVIG